ncbi:MAG: ATP-binding protein [Candidatus Omnitrophota bacterium]
MRIFDKIQNKFLIIMLFFSIIPLFVFGIYTTKSVSKELEIRALESAGNDVLLRAKRIEKFLDNARSDIIYLSKNPVLLQLLNEKTAENEAWTNRKKFLADEFLAFSESKQIYNQIRYIDEKGQEIVRVDSDGGKSWIVPWDELQDKSQRYYFSKAMEIMPGQIYVSPLDLNRENEKIEVPYNPVIRYAVPVYNKLREKRGIIILNISASCFLRELEKQYSFLGEEIFLISQDGFYLFHQDKKKEWGGPRDLNSGENFVKSYPKTLVLEVLKAKAGKITGLKNEVMVYEPIFPSPEVKDYFWMLIINFTKELLFQPAKRFNNILMSIILLVVIVAVVVGVFFVKLLTDPLHSMMAAAKRVGEGDITSRAECKSNDEIGELCNIFNRMTQQLQKYQDKLVTSSKLAAIGEISATIIHEIRNPLGAVKLALYSINREIKDEKLIQNIKDVDKKIDEIDKIISNLLGYTKLNVQKFEQVYLPDIIKRQMKEISHRFFQANVKTELSIDPDLPFVSCDLSAIKMVFTNLLINAYEAISDKEGRVGISLSYRKAEDKVEILIRDNGCGITEADQKRLGELLFSRKTKGVGLGLNLVYKIIELHSGSIKIKSKLGGGTVFTVILPVRQSL